MYCVVECVLTGLPGLHLNALSSHDHQHHPQSPGAHPLHLPAVYQSPGFRGSGVRKAWPVQHQEDLAKLPVKSDGNALILTYFEAS